MELNFEGSMVIAQLGGRMFAILALCAAPLLMGNLGPRENLNDRLLAAQNRERAIMGVAPLKWNPTLAAGAHSWARHLARTGRFEHSPDDLAAEPAGENLWAGTIGHYSPEAMIKLWVAEKLYYKPGVFPNNSRTGRVESVSHYTQLVWADTNEVGCALERGKVEDILVCRYARAGNVIGKRVM
jgi:hypothetical protein